MKKYWKLIIALAAFLVLFAGSRMLYGNLSEQYGAEQMPLVSTGEETDIGMQDEGQGDKDVQDEAGDETSQEKEQAGGAVQDKGEQGKGQASEGQDKNAQTKGEQGKEEQAETAAGPTVEEFDFTVTDVDGTERTLSSFVGKPIVLNFWASWCSICRKEFPDFQSAYETYGSDVEFVMVNVTDGFRETESKAKDFIDENGYTFPVYYDLEQDAASVYGVRSLPTTYFIDAEGTIITYARGMLTEESLQKGMDMIQPKPSES